jgi:hypothetical protein
LRELHIARRRTSANADNINNFNCLVRSRLVLFADILDRLLKKT